MSRVWKHAQQREAPLLVLLALADGANDEGLTWQSVETLAQMARIERRSVQRVLRKLEADGEIQVVDIHPETKTTIYRVLSRPVVLPAVEGGDGKSPPLVVREGDGKSPGRRKVARPKVAPVTESRATPGSPYPNVNVNAPENANENAGVNTGGPDVRSGSFSGMSEGANPFTDALGDIAQGRAATLAREIEERLARIIGAGPAAEGAAMYALTDRWAAGDAQRAEIVRRALTLTDQAARAGRIRGDVGGYWWGIVRGECRLRKIALPTRRAIEEAVG